MHTSYTIHICTKRMSTTEHQEIITYILPIRVRAEQNILPPITIWQQKRVKSTIKVKLNGLCYFHLQHHIKHTKHILKSY